MDIVLKIYLWYSWHRQGRGISLTGGFVIQVLKILHKRFLLALSLT